MSPAKKKPMLPPAYFLLAIIAMILLRVLVPRFGAIAMPVNLIGIAPIAIGLALGIGGDRVFKRRGTTIKPFETSTALVTDGIFRFTRNPMYLGLVLILIGLGLVLGTVAPFVVVPVFIWLLTSRFIVREEAMLEEHFGEAYNQYKRRVRRWI